MRKIREALRLTQALGMSRRLVGEATGIGKTARAIAAASGGKLEAVDSLRWKTIQPPAHKQLGLRRPEPRYDNMVVIDCPELPIVLFDDVITSGSSFIAAYWRLQEAGNSPGEGLAIARRTVNQEPKMSALEERDLEIPQRLMF